MNTQNTFIDITGQTFYELTALEYLGKRSKNGKFL